MNNKNKGIHVQIPAGEDAKSKGEIHIKFEDTGESLDVRIQSKGIASQNDFQTIVANLGEVFGFTDSDWGLVMLLHAIHKEK